MTTERAEDGPDGDQGTDTGDDGHRDQGDGDAGDEETFPRVYVEKLRQEAADARVKAKRADDLDARLMAATIQSALAGKLADPTDLLRHTDQADLLDDDGYPDADKMSGAAQQLLADKPHLAPRTPSGNIDQGTQSNGPESVSLTGMIRGLAG